MWRSAPNSARSATFKATSTTELTTGSDLNLPTPRITGFTRDGNPETTVVLDVLGALFEPGLNATIGGDPATAWIKYYFYVHKLFGWILASFLIAGLAGLTQRS